MIFKKIVIADANYLAREGFKSLLSGNGADVEIRDVITVEDLKKTLKDFAADIIIVDPTFDSGFSLKDLRSIKQINPVAKVLQVSDSFTSEYLSHSITVGCKAFLTKKSEKVEVIAALDAVCNDEKFICKRLLDMVLHSTIRSEYSRRGVTLSKREVEVLQLIALSYTSKQIAEKLMLSFHTIISHRKNIFRKLNINTVTQLTKYAVEENLIT